MGPVSSKKTPHSPQTCPQIPTEVRAESRPHCRDPFAPWGPLTIRGGSEPTRPGPLGLGVTPALTGLLSPGGC